MPQKHESCEMSDYECVASILKLAQIKKFQVLPCHSTSFKSVHIHCPQKILLSHGIVGNSLIDVETYPKSNSILEKINRQCETYKKFEFKSLLGYLCGS